MLLQAKRVHQFGLALAVPALIVAGACSKESKQPSPVTTRTEAGKSQAPESGQGAAHMSQALVRVVNAAPEAKAVDVLADSNPTFADVDYKTVTPYKNVPASADDFAITPAGDTQAQPLAKNSTSISGGRHYTIVALPASAADGTSDKTADKAPSKLELQVIDDDIEPPAEGKARVRVINASPDAPTLAVFVKGQQDALFTDVDFKEAASYKEVDPASATLEFRPTTDARRPALTTARVNLEPGKTYTLIVAGHRQGRTGTVDTILIEDTLTGPQLAPTE
jgi:hypothetical protein